jgi:hypothetical protein
MRLATERPRSRALFAVYPILALAAFPTIGILVGGTRAWMYGLDVFDDGGGLTRLAIAVREWSAHGLSLWDPYLTAGNAFLGQFALPPIAPDVALAFAVGPFAAFAVMGWATATLAGIGTHLFLRDGLGLSTPAAVGGSILAASVSAPDLQSRSRSAAGPRIGDGPRPSVLASRQGVSSRASSPALAPCRPDPGSSPWPSEGGWIITRPGKGGCERGETGDRRRQ